jgi:hypothetical protein
MNRSTPSATRRKPTYCRVRGRPSSPHPS